jgi:hypothetical protein
MRCLCKAVSKLGVSVQRYSASGFYQAVSQIIEVMGMATRTAA